MQVRVAVAVQFQFHHREKTVAMFSAGVFAVALIFVVIICRHEGAAGDLNCKTKVRDMLLKHCVNSGVRSKRDVSQVDLAEDHLDSEPPASRGFDKRQIISPQASAALMRTAESMITDILSGIAREFRGQGIPGPQGRGYVENPGRPDGSFHPVLDDLGSGLSESVAEDLLEEVFGRYSRSPKNKDETVKMITAYAAKCCNENLNDDSCDNPANFITCP